MPWIWLWTKKTMPSYASYFFKVPFPLSCSTLSRGGFARPSVRPSICPFTLSSLNPFCKCLVCRFVCLFAESRPSCPPFFLSFRVFLLFASLTPNPMGFFVLAREAV
jgi:hypothetical protein